MASLSHLSLSLGSASAEVVTSHRSEADCDGFVLCTAILPTNSTASSLICERAYTRRRRIRRRARRVFFHPKHDAFATPPHPHDTSGDTYVRGARVSPHNRVSVTNRQPLAPALSTRRDTLSTHSLHPALHWNSTSLHLITLSPLSAPHSHTSHAKHLSSKTPPVSTAHVGAATVSGAAPSKLLSNTRTLHPPTNPISNAPTT